MYFIKNGYPFECNYAMPSAIKISKSKYNKLVKAFNDKAKVDRQAKLDELQANQEYEAQVQAEIRAIAVANLEARGVTAPVKKVKG